MIIDFRTDPVPNEFSEVIIVDRDGTLIVDQGYSPHLEKVEYISGTIKFILQQPFTTAIVMASNQSSISKGLRTIEDVLEFNRKITDQMYSTHGAFPIIAICPHESSTPPLCHCRKPNSGMLRFYQNYFSGVASSKFTFLGNSISDLEASKRVNMRYIDVGTFGS